MLESDYNKICSFANNGGLYVGRLLAVVGSLNVKQAKGSYAPVWHRAGASGQITTSGRRASSSIANTYLRATGRVLAPSMISKCLSRFCAAVPLLWVAAVLDFGRPSSRTGVAYLFPSAGRSSGQPTILSRKAFCYSKSYGLN